MNDKNKLNKKELSINNEIIITDKNNDDINMEDKMKIDEEYNNIYEDIKDFISFDKNKNSSNKNEKKNKNNNYNVYQKIYMNDYLNINRINNIKNVNDFPEKTSDLFENFPPLNSEKSM